MTSAATKLSSYIQTIEKVWQVSESLRSWNFEGELKAFRLREISRQAKLALENLQEAMQEDQEMQQKKTLKRAFFDLTADLSGSLVKIKKAKFEACQEFQLAKGELKELLKQNVKKPLRKLQNILREKFLTGSLDESKLTGWLEEFAYFFSEDVLQSMPKDLTCQYASHLHALGKRMPSQMKGCLPIYAQSYIQILESRDSYAGKVGQIQGLFAGDENMQIIGLACFVNAVRVPVKDLAFLPKNTFLAMAPHLRFVDLRGDYEEKDLNFEIELVEKCLHVDFLFIKNSKIKSLPELRNCQYLDCANCTALEVLPELSSCRKLYCSFCVNLQSIPALAHCEELDCHFCPKLLAIAELPNGRLVNCRDCELLECVLALPICEEFDCAGCKALQRLPKALPCCQIMNCSGCHMLQVLPEVPFSSTVYHDNEVEVKGAAKLEIDLDRLAINPWEYFLQLGKGYLLQEGVFPRVYYFQGSKLSEAIDVGGVRRDFVTRLFEHLEKGALLPLFQEQERGIWPVMDNDSKTRQGLQTLGRLLALCYAQTCDFKTGEIFDPNLFRVIKIRGINSYLEEAQIQAFLLINGLPIAAVELTSGKVNASNFSEKVLTNLSFLLHPEGIEENLVTYFSRIENQQILRGEILKKAGQEGRLLAAAIIANEMRKSMAPTSYSAFFSEELEVSLQKIQGELTLDRLKAELQWLAEEKVSIENPVKGFLLNWLDRASKVLLRNFVRFVTGNNSLGKRKLDIIFYDRDVQYMPTARTCFFSLELSVNYPNQTFFDQKLNQSIEEGLACSGFQID